MCEEREEVSGLCRQLERLRGEKEGTARHGHVGSVLPPSEKSFKWLGLSIFTFGLHQECRVEMAQTEDEKSHLNV